MGFDCICHLCVVDVEINTYAANPGTQQFLDSETIAYTFDVTIANVANVFTGNHIIAPPTTPANAHNYKFIHTFSDVDLGAGATDTLSLPNVTANAQYDQTMLAQGASVSLATVTAVVQLPVPSTPDTCTSVKYSCIYVVEGDSAVYKDANHANSRKCVDISTVKNCRPGWLNSRNNLRDTLLIASLNDTILVNGSKIFSNFFQQRFEALNSFYHEFTMTIDHCE